MRCPSPVASSVLESGMAVDAEMEAVISVGQSKDSVTVANEPQGRELRGPRHSACQRGLAGAGRRLLQRGHEAETAYSIA